MRRRNFIAGLASTTAALPLAARAQRSAVSVIGYLGTAAPGELRELLAAFHRGLKEAGYIEGQNVRIEYRWGEGQYNRLPTLAAELVQRQPTVIVTTGGSRAALAAKAATTKIPIIFSTGEDPVETGIVSSLNRPNGNVTGATFLTAVLEAKRLELLHELLPSVGVIALLVNPTNASTKAEIQQAQEAAGRLGVKLIVLNAANEDEIDVSFATMIREGAGAAVRVPPECVHVMTRSSVSHPESRACQSMRVIWPKSTPSPFVPPRRSRRNRAAAEFS
jgi:putative tryptophan/tyrosine transport system substrate-binding protein